MDVRDENVRAKRVMAVKGTNSTGYTPIGSGEVVRSAHRAAESPQAELPQLLLDLGDSARRVRVVVVHRAGELDDEPGVLLCVGGGDQAGSRGGPDLRVEEVDQWSSASASSFGKTRCNRQWVATMNWARV